MVAMLKQCHQMLSAVFTSEINAQMMPSKFDSMFLPTLLQRRKILGGQTALH